MSYLRFSPREYQAICDVCHALNFNRCRPPTLRHLLARSLADTFPTLADRLRHLRHQEMEVLHAHLRDQGQPCERHGLSDDEFSLVAAVCRPLLARTRFIGTLKPTLFQHLRDDHPELAAKLAGLGQARFESLCEQVKLWVLGTS
jgi:glutathione S-transferase